MKNSWQTNFKRKTKIERTYDGKVFDSMSEMKRYRALKLMQRAKVISHLRCQVSFPLILPGGFAVLTPTGKTAKYTCDFEYVENGDLVIEDHKGFMDRGAQFRIAVFEAIYGVKVHISH